MNFNKWGPLTVLIVALVLICTVAGAIVTIEHPDTLSFKSFLDAVAGFVIGLGILGVGHGVSKR